MLIDKEILIMSMSTVTNKMIMMIMSKEWCRTQQWVYLHIEHKPEEARSSWVGIPRQSTHPSSHLGG